jgi:hypothetical protein
MEGGRIYLKEVSVGLEIKRYENLDEKRVLLRKSRVRGKGEVINFIKGGIKFYENG